MKRLVAIFVVFLIILSSGIINVSAASPVISISDKRVSAGEKVKLDVSIKGNPGVSGLYLKIRYDSPLKLTDVKDKGIMKGKYFSSSTDTVPYVLSWDDSVSGNDNYSDGVLAQLEFKVPEGTSDGVYRVSISYEDGDIFNSKLNNIRFSTVNGSIIVGSQFVFSDTEDMFRNGEFFCFTKGKTVGDVINNSGAGAYVTGFSGKKENTQLLVSGDIITFSDNSSYTCVLAGDNDSDGKITSSDARNALRCSVGLESLSSWQLRASDADRSGTITASDARLILRAGVGLENADKWIIGLTRESLSIHQDFALTDKPLKTPQGQYNAAGSYVISQLKNFVTMVDIGEYKIRYDDGKLFIKEFINVVPELFYVVNSVNVYARDGIIEKMEFAFIDNAKEKVQEYNKLIDDIAGKADKSWSDAKKVLFFHDYICSNFSYDNDLKIYDAYSMLKNGKGVCQAYALLMKALLQQHSVETRYVTSEKMKHGWNIVKIDNQWYHVDATWDDMKNDIFGQALHENVLLSDEAIEDTGHKDWYCFGGNEECTDMYYDGYFWKSVTSPFVCLDSNWYYIDKYLSGYAIYKWENSGNHTVVKSFSAKWTGFLGAALSDCYSCLCVYDNALIYNTGDSVISFDPETGERKILYYENTNKQIFGMLVNKDIFINLVSTASGDGAFPIRFMYQGDCDNNGKVNGRDYALISKYLNGNKTDINTRNADFDFNGKLNARDAEAIRKFIVN